MKKGFYEFELNDFGALVSRKLRIRSKDRTVDKIVDIQLTRNPVLNHAKWVDNYADNDNGTRKPLVFVHGIALSIAGYNLWPEEKAWDNLLRFFRDSDLFKTYKPYIFMYDSNDTDNTIPVKDGVEAVGECLAQFMHSDSNLKNKNITIIAHSMGGLVSRSMMELSVANGKQGGEWVDKLITLFTPHRGSPLPNFPPVGLKTDMLNGLNSKFLEDISWDVSYKMFPASMFEYPRLKQVIIIIVVYKELTLGISTVRK